MKNKTETVLKTNEAGVCKGRKRSSYRFQDDPCSFKVWKDGYCKIHHPAERNKKQQLRYKKKDDLFRAAQKRLETELLPCPFCGNTPYVKVRESRRGQSAEAELYHDNAACPVVVLIKRSCQTKEHVIKLWNTRA